MEDAASSAASGYLDSILPGVFASSWPGAGAAGTPRVPTVTVSGWAARASRSLQRSCPGRCSCPGLGDPGGGSGGSGRAGWGWGRRPAGCEVVSLARGKSQKKSATLLLLSVRYCPRSLERAIMRDLVLLYLFIYFPAGTVGSCSLEWDVCFHC